MTKVKSKRVSGFHGLQKHNGVIIKITTLDICEFMIMQVIAVYILIFQIIGKMVEALVLNVKIKLCHTAAMVDNIDFLIIVIKTYCRFSYLNIKFIVF